MKFTQTKDGLLDDIAKHTQELAPHIKTRKSAQLLIAAEKEIKRLLGVASWASGRLLDAGDIESSDNVLKMINRV